MSSPEEDIVDAEFESRFSHQMLDVWTYNRSYFNLCQSLTHHTIFFKSTTFQILSQTKALVETSKKSTWIIILF